MTETNAEHPSPDGSVVSLRGPAAVSIGRRLKLVASGLGLVIFAVALTVSFLSILNDNARFNRMMAHGIPVSVTVTNCRGNIGGSGSNSAGYTCRGVYAVNGINYDEPIGSKITFTRPGTEVSAVVDPSHHGTVVLSSAIRTSAASQWRYLPLVLLSLVFVALILAFLRVARRSTPLH